MPREPYAQGLVDEASNIVGIINTRKIGYWAMLPPEEWSIVSGVLDTLIRDINESVKEQ